MASKNGKTTPEKADSHEPLQPQPSLAPTGSSFALLLARQLAMSVDATPTYQCSAYPCVQTFRSLNQLWLHEASHLLHDASSALFVPSSSLPNVSTENLAPAAKELFCSPRPIVRPWEVKLGTMASNTQQQVPRKRVVRPRTKCNCSLCTGSDENLRAVEGNKKHICDIPNCGKLFDFPSQLRAHARTVRHRGAGDETDGQGHADMHDNPLRATPEVFRLKKSKLSGLEKETWESLRLTVTAIMTGAKMPYSWQEMCQAAERLCQLERVCEQVFEHLKEVLEYRVKQLALELLSEPLGGVIFLGKLYECWTVHCRRISRIRDLFHKLDVTQQQPHLISPVMCAGLESFKKHIVLNPKISPRTVDELLLLIDKERQGNTAVDRMLLKSLLQMLMDLQLYSNIFASRFLEATEKFYAAEGQRLAQVYDVPEYLAHMNKRLQEENERLLHYLDSSTKSSLIHTVEKQLSRHVASILRK